MSYSNSHKVETYERKCCGIKIEFNECENRVLKIAVFCYFTSFCFILWNTKLCSETLTVSHWTAYDAPLTWQRFQDTLHGGMILTSSSLWRTKRRRVFWTKPNCYSVLIPKFIESLVPVEAKLQVYDIHTVYTPKTSCRCKKTQSCSLALENK